MKAPPDSRKLPDSTRWQVVLACTAGIVVVGFLIFAFLNTSQQVSGHGLNGVIIEKVFVSEPETQFTVGQGGLRSEEVAGRYTLRVRVDSENGRIYRVPVSREVFEGVKENDPYFFVKTPERFFVK